MLVSLASVFGLGLALADQESTRPMVLWDELGDKPAIVHLARGGKDRKDPFAELKRKRAAEQSATDEAEEKPKPAQAPTPVAPAGES